MLMSVFERIGDLIKANINDLIVFLCQKLLGNLYKLPKKWLIVSAGNLVTDRAVATVMPSALANRFTGGR